MSEWYLNEAMRLIEAAKKLKGVSRRKKVLATIRNLIAYIVGRRAPEINAVACTDDSTCDRCFRFIHDGLNRTICARCEHGVTKGGHAKKKGSKIGEHSSKRGPENKCANHPEHETRIRKHRARVRKKLIEVGLERELSNDE